jgi:hypothetical protein
MTWGRHRWVGLSGIDTDLVSRVRLMLNVIGASRSVSARHFRRTGRFDQVIDAHRLVRRRG